MTLSRRAFTPRLLFLTALAMASTYGVASAQSEPLTSDPTSTASPTPMPSAASPSSSSDAASSTLCTSQGSCDLSVSWLAALILHEAVHMDQFDRGDHYYGRSAEHAASTVQQQFLERIGSHFKAYRRFDDLPFKVGPAFGNPIDATLIP
jgi:hypothetical protein